VAVDQEQVTTRGVTHYGRGRRWRGWRSGVAGVADTIAIAVRLICVPRSGAVIRIVWNAVPVGIWRRRGRVAGIADTIAIAVRLVCVPRARAVVRIVRNAVSVRIRGGRRRVFPALVIPDRLPILGVLVPVVVDDHPVTPIGDEPALAKSHDCRHRRHYR
jgi:hypothetical protein